MIKNFLKKIIYKNKSCKKDMRAGFTLIELLVAVGLFAIVIVITLGAITTVIDVNRKSQTLTVVMNNLSFSLESIVRTIKTATEINYNTGTGLYEFKDQRSLYVSYRQNGNTIERCETDISGTCNNWLPIIATQVYILDGGFDLIAFDYAPDTHPRFLMKVVGYVDINRQTRTDFNIQTTISPRVVNFGNALSLP